MGRNRTHRPKGPLALASPLMELSAGRRESLVPSAASRVVRPVIQTLEERCLLAGAASSVRVPALIKDININTSPSDPSVLTNVGGTLYFAASEPARGRELWKSDGTSAGTVLVKDIVPGPGSSSPSILTNVGGTLFFATDAASGTELWKSDGTATGTVPIKSLRSNNFGVSFTPRLTDVDGTLYFMASDAASGTELWKSDGTPSGTVLVKDINPGTANSNPDNLTNVDGTLFFQAFDVDNGFELWRSDGTSAGTAMVRDIYSGTAGSNPSALFNLGGTLFFQARDATKGVELWKSDGTSAGTVMVKDINPGTASSNPNFLTNVSGTLYFNASNRLWRSDGTTAGTVMLEGHSYLAGTLDSPTSLTNVDGTLFFSGSDLFGGRELWKSNGTSAGTVLVANINRAIPPIPTTWSSDPSELTNVGGTLFFVADPGNGGHNRGGEGRRLWRYKASDVWPTALTDASLPGSLTNVSGTLFFANSVAASGRELWKSSVAGGPALVKDINTFTDASSAPTGLTNAGGTLLFAANDGINGGELWRSDGTSAGTVLLKNIFPGSTGSSPASLTNVNGTVFFQASSGYAYDYHGYNRVFKPDLWRSDGTPAGTFRVWSGSRPFGLTNVGGTLFFSGSEPSYGSELWKSDGQPVMVRDINPGSTGSDPLNLTNVGGTLFFAASNALGAELWRSNGTSAGTVLVKDINPGPDSSAPIDLTNVGGMLFFTATDASGRELWRSDGTPAGTVMVRDLNPGSDSSTPRYLTNVGGTLYFVAGGPSGGRELWRSDGTTVGTVMVRDLNPGPDSSAPIDLTNVGGMLYFTATDASGTELWRSDGTPAGTVMVRDVNPGSDSSTPRYLTNVGGTLYFVAGGPSGGRELWRSDGTTAGTVMVGDINPGPDSSRPRYLTNVGGTLYFTATGPIGGNELWALVPDVTPPAVSISSQPPPVSTSTEASFNFTGTDDGTLPADLAFRVSLDGGAFAAATSPASYTRLHEGAHAFLVEAIDLAGNIGVSATYTWIVDTTAPAVTAPDDVTAEATGAAGAAVAFAPATAIDAVTASPAVAYFDGLTEVHSGDLFSLGVHTIVVRATDDAGNVGSARFTITVTPQAPVNRATTTTLATTPDPSTVGLPVTLTATVATLSGQATPTGTVTFTIDGQAQAPVPLQAVGSLAQATLTVSTLAAGPHAIAASYGGAPGFDPSAAGPMTQTVRYSSTIMLSAIPGNASTLGQAVTLTAVVTGDGPGLPTGQVTFQDGDRLLATVPLAGSASNAIRSASNGRTATASFAVVLPPGRHVLSATYSGSADYAASGVTTVYQASGTTSPLDGPRVVGVSRFGYHAQPTTLLLRFDGPLAPLPASDPANYRIITIGGPGRGGQRRGRVIPIASVDYHAGSSTLLIHPAARLDVHNTYRLVVTGAAPTGLSDASGRPLDGQGTGRPGSDFVTAITRKTLVKAVPARAVDALVASGNLPVISHAAFRRRADWQWKELSFLRVIREGKERVMGDRSDPTGPRAQGTQSR